MELSSRSHVNTTCCLHDYMGYSNFAQILNDFIRKLTSLRFSLKIKITQKIFTDYRIKKYLENAFMKMKVVLKVSKKDFICVLPFLGKKLKQLIIRLVNSTESNLKFCKLKVIFQSPCKLNSLFRYKDSLLRKTCSDIV